MIAVLADLGLQRTDPVLREFEIAAVNSSRHFVLACEDRRASLVEQRLRELGVTHQRLPVSYAFHSRLIEPIKDALAPSGEALRLRPPQVPLACCAAGDVIESLPEDYFWSVARQPIRFDRAIAALEQRGPCRYIDLGPSGSMGAMLKYALHPASKSTVEITLGYFESDLRNVQSVISRGRSPVTLPLDRSAIYN
jgi:acyl transferase domain-containing protein